MNNGSRPICSARSALLKTPEGKRTAKEAREDIVSAFERHSEMYLLDLAAKALDATLMIDPFSNEPHIRYKNSYHPVKWNPLKNKADSFDLMTALSICPEPSHDNSHVICWSLHTGSILTVQERLYSVHDMTMLAVVKHAAEIYKFKQLKDKQNVPIR